MTAEGSGASRGVGWWRSLPLLGIAALSLFNGLTYSPIFDSVQYYLDSFFRDAPYYHPEVFFQLTSWVIAAMTVLVAGVPAALYERATGSKESGPTSLRVWFLATAGLSLPGILGAAGLG
jgi:hypothetical protein